MVYYYYYYYYLWRRNYLTIDMFKFTDVTASHVYRVRKYHDIFENIEISKIS